MHSLMISSEVRPRMRSVFSCILRMTRAWLSEPPLTPMRTGLPWLRATAADRRELFVAPLSRAHVSGIDTVLIEGRRRAWAFRQQDVAVVVKIADQRGFATGVEHALLDLRHGRCSLGDVHRDADQFGARLRELNALPRGACGVRCIGIGHRLDDDGRAAADGDSPDFHCMRFAPLNHAAAPRCSRLS